MSESVLLERAGRVGIVRLNRPGQLNCLDTRSFIALRAAFAECESAPDIGAVVLTGSGRAFCAGGDLSVLRACDSAGAAETNMQAANAAVAAIYGLPKPVIAAVNGVAAGAGFNLALCCDMIFAAEDASFIQAFAKVGIALDCGGHWLLSRAVGPYIAKELTLSCRPVSAEEGRRLGFVNRVFPAAVLESETVGYAQALASGPPLAVAAIKSLLNKSAEMPFQEMLDEELRAQIPLLLSEDCKEGIAAFYEKRAPVYRGR